ncbi:unnamed protein product [Pedinophyceae sp. YPF-701]|nr:unnamed protein product [Pedinophyceae sp. YPF-701]
MAGHGNASYNLVGDEGTLMGNWVEERALCEASGNTRYKSWLGANAEKPKTVYATRVKKPDYFDSFQRVFEQVWHEDIAAGYEYQFSGKDSDHFTSTHNADFLNPATRGGPCQYRTIPKYGRRELARQKEAAAAAAEELASRQQHAPEPALTTYRAEHCGPESGALRETVGRRITRDRDGRPARRDGTWLAESGLLSRGLSERAAGEGYEGPAGDNPAYLLGRTGPRNDLAATKLKRAEWFGIDSNYTMPIGDYRKKVVD